MPGSKLRRLSSELNIEDKVTFAGSVKQERLPYYYSAADVCVISSYYESFGLVALESLACGTPVVATNTGAVKHIIRHAEMGYVVSDNSPHRLADKIAWLLSRPKTEANSAQSIRASVSAFSWDKTARAVLKVCRRALAKYPALVS